MSDAVRIARVGVRAFDLPLVRPLVVGGRAIERRGGLLVIVEDASGHAGVGEVAPLPGLHRESHDDAAAQVLALAAALEGATIPERCAALDGAFDDWLGGRGLLPSVRAGVEGAVLSLLADRAGTSLARLLASNPDGRVGVNGLLDGAGEPLLDEAARLAGAGYSALKLKVGRRDPQAEALLVAAVRARVGDGVALRLDANRAWDLPTALAFAARVDGARIAYLEEPLRDARDRRPFVERSPVPVALDETLLDHSPRQPPALRGVAALILKPAVLGGFEHAMGWARLAQRERLDAVVSAAFPSAVGLALEAAFAAALGGGTVHGLGTAGALAADLARSPLVASGGTIDVARLPRHPRDFALEGTRELR